MKTVTSSVVGITVCDVALYLKWYDLGEYTIRNPQIETGHWSIYSVQFLALMAVPLALMVRPAKFRPAANIVAVVLALAVAASWIWRIQLIRNGLDAMKDEGDLSTPPAAIFHLGSAVFGVGVLLVLAAAVGVTIRDRVVGIHLPGRREAIGSSP